MNHPVSLGQSRLGTDILALVTAAVHITLTEEEIKHLEEPYQPQAVIGHL